MSHYSNGSQSSNDLLMTPGVVPDDVAISQRAKFLRKANKKHRTISLQIDDLTPRSTPGKPEQHKGTERSNNTKHRAQEVSPSPLEESPFETSSVYEPSREVLALENFALRARIREIEGIHATQSAQIPWVRNPDSPPDYNDSGIRI